MSAPNVWTLSQEPTEATLQQEASAPLGEPTTEQYAELTEHQKAALANTRQERLAREESADAQDAPLLRLPYNMFFPVRPAQLRNNLSNGAFGDWPVSTFPDPQEIERLRREVIGWTAKQAADLFAVPPHVWESIESGDLIASGELLADPYGGLETRQCMVVFELAQHLEAHGVYDPEGEDKRR